MSIFEKIKKIVIDQLQVSPEEVTEKSKLVQDLGADSLDIVEIAMTIEEELRVDLPDEVVPTLKTVGDFIAYTENHKN